jgi:hypothetical protein
VPNQLGLLLDVREHDDFLGDLRETQAAEIRARRFAQSDSADTPFSEQEGREVADALKELKDSVKAAEASKLQITKPYRDTVKHVNDQYTELLAKPKAAIEVLTRRGLATKRELDRQQAEAERERREELQRREEEAAAQAAEAARKAEADREDAAAQAAAAEARRKAAQAAAASAQRAAGADAKPKQLRGNFASLGSTTTYKWDVFDLDALPDEHKTFNKKSIDAAVKAEKAMAKAQGREFNLQLLPGVRIWPVERGVSR